MNISTEIGDFCEGFRRQVAKRIIGEKLVKEAEGRLSEFSIDVVWELETHFISVHGYRTWVFISSAQFGMHRASILQRFHAI